MFWKFMGFIGAAVALTAWLAIFLCCALAAVCLLPLQMLEWERDEASI